MGTSWRTQKIKRRPALRGRGLGEDRPTDPYPLPALRCAVLRSIGTLSTENYIEAAIFFGIVLVFYFLFSLPMSYIKHYKLDFVNAEQLK